MEWLGNSVRSGTCILFHHMSIYHAVHHTWQCTERSGTEKKGMVWEHIPMFILYWWMTVYGAERGIKRMIIYISAWTCILFHHMSIYHAVHHSWQCTEQSGTEKKGMVWEHIPMFILYWWMTVYGAERGIRRLIIEICTWTCILFHARSGTGKEWIAKEIALFQWCKSKALGT
jgi:hypothetical protein